MNNFPDKPTANTLKIFVPMIVTICIIPILIYIGLTETQKRNTEKPYFAPSSTPLPTILRGPIIATPTPLASYSSWAPGIGRDEMIDIFLESILTKNQDKYALYRWQTPVKVWLRGQPTADDRECANLAVNELARQMSSTKAVLSENEGNFVVYLLPNDKFSSIEPDVSPTSIVEFFPKHDLSTQTFTGAKLLISNDLFPHERCLHFRRFFIRGLGAHTVTKSFSSVNYLSANSAANGLPYGPIDREIIRILYSDYMTPGLTGAEITRRLTD